MVTLGEVIDKVQKAGIARTTGTFARNAEGTAISLLHTTTKPAACCMLGALLYAENQGWCTPEESMLWVDTFVCRTGHLVSHANDKLGYTFEDFVAVVDRNEVKA